ncbi:MAG: sugar phosphate nucleotidyltransferase [Bacillota bacterium]|jgi:mannose-1-phosphate guanylyltransferase/phosphomannomutase
MAGGSGTRLRPLTCDLPKPMVPILNKPVMSYIVELLKKYGIRDIAVTLAYLPGKIKDYFGNGAEHGVNLQYFLEDSPLGTAGSVKNTGDFLRDTFLVISGDALTDLDIARAIAFHRERGSQATLVLHRQPVPLEYGVVVTDQEGRITRFLEKPSWGEVFSDTVNTGIYILEPGVMDYLAPGEKYDFSRDLFPRLLADGVPMYGYVTDGYWCDIGDLRSYRQANFDVLAGKVKVAVDGRQVRPGIWLAEGVRPAQDVDLIPPVYIGRGCSLDTGVSLGPNAILGEHCRVRAGTTLRQAVVWKHCRLGSDCEIRGATICNNVSLALGVRLFEDSVVGAGTSLEQGAAIGPGVKVWPGKSIAPETEVKSHLVWGGHRSRRLFGLRDVAGQFNVEVTPEFASRLGSAFASLTGEEGSIVVGSDAAPASALVADALAAGILASGLGVIRGGGLAAPITRFAVGRYGARGGIHVRLEAGDTVRLEFYNARGVNLDRGAERKLEAAFNSDDFRRVDAGQVALADRSPDILRQYFAWGARGLRTLAPGRQGPLVAAGAETELMAFLGSGFLAHVGCQVRRGGSTLAAVSAAVLEHGAEMGVFFRADGEEILLVDEGGIPVSAEAYRALATWIALQAEGKRIVIPHAAPQVLRDMAAGAEVVPVKSAPGEVMALMQELGEEDQRVAIQYLLNFDGIQAAARVADFLEQAGASLAQVVAGLPQLHYKKLAVPCKWEDKGRVLRELAALYRPEEMELEEGVKVLAEKGWALVLPDSERPQFNIYAQGYSEEYAQELAVEFSAKVSSLLGGGEE